MDTTAFSEGFEKIGIFGLSATDLIGPNTIPFLKNKAKETFGYGIKTVTDNPSVRKFIGNNVSPETKAQLANDEISKAGYGNYGSVEVGPGGKLQPKFNLGGVIKGFGNTVMKGITDHPGWAALGVGAGGLGLMSLLGGGNSGGGTVNNYYSTAPAGQTIKPNLQANIQSGDGFSAAGYHQV